MGKTTMDGSEQTLFESTELKEFSGEIFLDKMQAGDSMELAIYIKDGEEDAYKLYQSYTYSGVQTKPVVRIPPIMSKSGIKITLHQTSGAYRVITHQWFGR